MTNLEYIFCTIGVGTVTLIVFLLLGIACGFIEWNFKITKD